MKEQRTIELKRENVLEILAKHYGVKYRWSEYGRKDKEELGDEETNIKIYWEGNEKKLEDKKEEKKKRKTGQEILENYDKQYTQLNGRNYNREMTFLSALLQIREDMYSVSKDIHFMAEAASIKMREELKEGKE